MIGIKHDTHLIGSHHAKGEHIYFPHPNGRPPLYPWIGFFSDILATLPPGFQVSCGINSSSSVVIIHMFAPSAAHPFSSLPCKCSRTFLYFYPVSPNSWNFAVHKVSLRTSSTLCGACSFHLLPRDMPGSFPKTELFSPSGFRGGGKS